MVQDGSARSDRALEVFSRATSHAFGTPPEVSWGGGNESCSMRPTSARDVDGIGGLVCSKRLPVTTKRRDRGPAEVETMEK